MNDFFKGVGSVGLGALAGAGLAATSLVAIEALMPKPANASTVMSSCWRMTSADGSMGIGDGISWKLLGTCHVTLGSNGTPVAIHVVNPAMRVSGTFQHPKPYQNPTGVWVYGVKTSSNTAIWATQTW